MCFGYARPVAAIHLESQVPETRRRAVEPGRFLQMPAPAPLAISDDAAREPRSPLKMLFPEMAALTHRPALPRRFCSDSFEQVAPQTSGCTPGSSLAQHACVTLLLLHPAQLQFPERALPIPNRTRATESLASASAVANTTKRKTSSRTDSQTHVQSSAQKKCCHTLLKKELVF